MVSPLDPTMTHSHSHHNSHPPLPTHLPPRQHSRFMEWERWRMCDTVTMYILAAAYLHLLTPHSNVILSRDWLLRYWTAEARTSYAHAVDGWSYPTRTLLYRKVHFTFRTFDPSDYWPFGQVNCSPCTVVFPLVRHIWCFDAEFW